jgi:hypothetical protein
MVAYVSAFGWLLVGREVGVGNFFLEAQSEQAFAADGVKG